MMDFTFETEEEICWETEKFHMSRIDIPTLIFCGDVEIQEEEKKKK